MKTNLPELQSILKGEPIDFLAKARKTMPLKKSIILLAGGLFCLVWFMLVFIGGTRANEDIRINDTLVNSDSLLGSIIVWIFKIVSVMVGIIGTIIIIFSINSMFAQGPLYMSTQKRLVIYKNNKSKSIPWIEFHNELKAENNSITLYLKKGHLVNRMYGHEKLVRQEITITGIPNAKEIEKILKKRINL